MPALFLTLACSEPAPVAVEARRGAPGYWPESSRLAIAGADRLDLDAIQLDLSATSDGVAVLLRGPRLDPARCTTDRGEALADPLPIAELSLAEVQQYRCGGLPQPSYPNALVSAEVPATIDEILPLIRQASATSIRFELAGEILADALFAAWSAADLPNDLVVASHDRNTLRRAADDWSGAGLALTTALVLDDGAKNDSVDAALDDGIDGIVVTTATPRSVRTRAHRDGLRIWLVVPDDPAADGPVDVISTDYPGDPAR